MTRMIIYISGISKLNWLKLVSLIHITIISTSVGKKIQPVHSEGDQPWDFFGRNDAEAETPVLWPPNAKNWLIGKDSDAGRDWGQEEKGTTEDEMAGWHHWLNGRESEQTPGVGNGQGGLACCDSWGCKELDTTERLILSDLICGQESLSRNGVAIIVNKRVRNAIIGYSLKNNRMISVSLQVKPFNITVIQVYAPISNADKFLTTIQWKWQTDSRY